MAKKLSSSLEDYLEAIAELSLESGHAHSKEIAAKLGVKMPSVTEALRQLVDMGYIIYNVHYPVQLTSTGKAVAEEIVRRHRILKRFFTEIPACPRKKPLIRPVIWNMWLTRIRFQDL